MELFNQLQKGRRFIVKRYSILIVTLVLIFGLAGTAEARNVGVINAEGDDARLSLDFGYSQAHFQEIEGSGESDTQLKNWYGGVRLEKAITDELQVYVAGGQSNNDWGDSVVEDGTRYGGGIQYVFNQEDNVYYKLFGSYMKNSEEDFRNDATRSLEVVSDWQAGLMISRNMTEINKYETLNQTHAYMTVLYSGKEVELTESGTVTEHEFSEIEGVSVTGGVRMEVEEGLDFEFEAEAGSSFGATARLSAAF